MRPTLDTESMRRSRHAAPTTPPTHRVVSSLDGSLVFVLSRTTRGLQIARKERTSAWSVDGFVSFVNVIRGEEQLQEFCDADPMRHQHPLVYAQLRREAYALFSIEP